MANRAIVLDHWWHKNLEQQAIGRIHRIGQLKTIHTAKMVVAGSMDEHVLHLQDKKERNIAVAVGGEELADDDDLELLGCYSQIGRELLAGLADISDDDCSSDSSSSGEGESDSEFDDSDDNDDEKDEDYEHDTDAEVDGQDGDEPEDEESGSEDGEEDD